MIPSWLSWLHKIVSYIWAFRDKPEGRHDWNICISIREHTPLLPRVVSLIPMAFYIWYSICSESQLMSLAWQGILAPWLLFLTKGLTACYRVFMKEISYACLMCINHKNNKISATFNYQHEIKQSIMAFSLKEWKHMYIAIFCTISYPYFLIPIKL